MRQGRPECHGIKMKPGKRVEDPDGTVFILYRCGTCGRKQKVKIRGG